MRERLVPGLAVLWLLALVYGGGLLAGWLALVLLTR
jgi:hypothetical protein